MKCDIVIVGAGLGGAAIAAILSRAGFDVVVVDRHAIYPADFRAEQLVGSQADALRRLGLLDGIVGSTTPMPNATATCHGTIIDTTHSPHYGVAYEDMVNGARALATKARFITGRVTGVTTSPDLQSVTLADGMTIETRLVVLATGPNGNALLDALGIGQTMLSKHHSLTLGFDVRTASRDVLVYYGERPGDRMDYLTLFPVGDTMRANLFCYVDPADPWVKSFRRDPRQTLMDAMPSLERTVGPIEIVGKIQVRPNSIHRAENVRQAGVVLIGDAYQSPCPAVGTGVGRILADVEALRRLLPAWFATPGMGADKIAQFYQDPAKRRFDAQAIRDSRQRRALCTDIGLRWRLHRAQHYYRRRALGAISRAIGRDSVTLSDGATRTNRLFYRVALGCKTARRAMVATLAALMMG